MGAWSKTTPTVDLFFLLLRCCANDGEGLKAKADLPEKVEEEVVGFDFVLELVEDEQRDGGEGRLVAGRHRVGPARVRRRIIVDDAQAQLVHQPVHQTVCQNVKKNNQIFTFKKVYCNR